MGGLTFAAKTERPHRGGGAAAAWRARRSTAGVPVPVQRNEAAAVGVGTDGRRGRALLAMRRMQQEQGPGAPGSGHAALGLRLSFQQQMAQARAGGVRVSTDTHGKEHQFPPNDKGGWGAGATPSSEGKAREGEDAGGGSLRAHPRSSSRNVPHPAIDGGFGGSLFGRASEYSEYSEGQAATLQTVFLGQVESGGGGGGGGGGRRWGRGAGGKDQTALSSPQGKARNGGGEEDSQCGAQPKKTLPRPVYEGDPNALCKLVHSDSTPDIVKVRELLDAGIDVRYHEVRPRTLDCTILQ